jgi:hypothetical protein
MNLPYQGIRKFIFKNYQINSDDGLELSTFFVSRHFSSIFSLLEFNGEDTWTNRIIMRQDWLLR